MIIFEDLQFGLFGLFFRWFDFIGLFELWEGQEGSQGQQGTVNSGENQSGDCGVGGGSGFGGDDTFGDEIDNVCNQGHEHVNTTGVVIKEDERKENAHENGSKTKVLIFDTIFGF